MIDFAPTKIRKACLFVDGSGGTPSEEMRTNYEAYSNIEPMLLQMLARFTFERGVLPFQLRYRFFNTYVCDIGGWVSEIRKQRFMEALGHLVRGRSSRVYIFWTGETWEEFCLTNPDLVDYSGCINACGPDWSIKASEHLEKQED